MIDQLVLLAHAVYSNKGVYAVLLGSGISRAAGIPTGWEITLELVRRVATAEGVADIADPAEWFQTTKGREPEYSALLDVLAKTAEERRGILHRFIEPTPEEIEAGVKVPTPAHRALARLAARRYVRVILTTNFDRLTETALRDAGIEPTVISSADDAAGALPLTHAGCVVIKLNGDYLDTRIRNTPAELAAYDPRMDQCLDRVLDEFGLVVIGWSGDWDEALRMAIARCPTRRFTTWWAAHGGRPQDRARDLIDARRAQVIAIEDADQFVGSLEQKVLALEDRPHPLSAKLAVAELKRYLLDPQHQIRLYDLVFGEVREAIARTDDITTAQAWDQTEFQHRVEVYEAASEILRPLAAIGARWCRDADETMWGEVVRRCCKSYRLSAGHRAWIDLQAYLPLLIFYAVGLGATAGDRFGLLKRVFETRVQLHKELSAVEGLLPFAAFSEGELADIRVWLSLTARGSVTPVSDRLLGLFGREVPDLAGDSADFEALFDRFEILAALSSAHQQAPGEFDPTQIWFRPGRFALRMSRFGFAANQAWFEQADAERDGWPPIAAGLFGGSFARLSKLRAGLEDWVRRIGW